MKAECVSSRYTLHSPHGPRPFVCLCVYVCGGGWGACACVCGWGGGGWWCNRVCARGGAQSWLSAQSQGKWGAKEREGEQKSGGKCDGSVAEFFKKFPPLLLTFGRRFEGQLHNVHARNIIAWKSTGHVTNLSLEENVLPLSIARFG